MADPSEIRSRISDSLDREESERERSYRRSRELIKSCRNIISGIVQNEEGDPAALIKEFRDLTQEGVRRKGFVEDSLTEMAEALLLEASLRGGELPLPDEIGLTERAYALGACDAVGELRRIALNRLIEGDTDGAVKIYERMKILFSLVDGLTYPSGMIQLKRKQDQARSSLDRTQGELTIAIAGRKAGGHRDDR
jgi:translin